MAERGEKGAFVTLATNDTYALGCLVLGNSLRRVKTVHQLVVMITDGVSSSMRNQLRRVFDLLYEVNLLDSKDPDNLQLLGRPDLNVTFTKFHCWRLTMFEKAVFLDADTLVLKNVDELFEREELSAAPDAGWPDCFNSGVFVFRPSDETYKKLLDFAVAKGSFDGGDQGLLNIYFRDWATKDIARHLPFIYNVVSQAFYSYLPAFTQFKQDVKIVHFIGATKPWHHPYNTSTKTVQPLPDSGHNQEFLQLWWDIFMSQVQPALDPSVMFGGPESTEGGLVANLAAMTIQTDPSEGADAGHSEQEDVSDQERKLNWEKGQMDYLGADAFENIQKKLDETLQGPVSEATPSTSPFSTKSKTSGKD
ncbi:glycogenin-1-like isoform X4 [Mizuhopecten yessoensis]|uniref:glycogenin-1-like isoform X4 n=1 Tax=Mizuhopecten yessoensis TaxID=6573 RepID=UPI000B45C30B|nr:glycogenin-1-like isoform X4 [Mizuhopecten yessoensis]